MPLALWVAPSARTLIKVLSAPTGFWGLALFPALVHPAPVELELGGIYLGRLCGWCWFRFSGVAAYRPTSICFNSCVFYFVASSCWWFVNLLPSKNPAVWWAWEGWGWLVAYSAKRLPSLWVLVEIIRCPRSDHKPLIVLPCFACCTQIASIHICHLLVGHSFRLFTYVHNWFIKYIKSWFNLI